MLCLIVRACLQAVPHSWRFRCGLARELAAKLLVWWDVKAFSFDYPGQTETGRRASAAKVVPRIHSPVSVGYHNPLRQKSEVWLRSKRSLQEVSGVDRGPRERRVVASRRASRRAAVLAADAAT